MGSHSYEKCSTLVTIQHGNLIGCTVRDGYEFGELHCHLGYEISSGVFYKEVLIDPENEFLNSSIICKRK